MVDNEKRDNLVNARRKLKKFRDQQQSNGVAHPSPTLQSNVVDTPSSNGAISPPSIISNNRMMNAPNFVHDPQTMLNGIYQNLSISPISAQEEPNRQYATQVEHQRQSNNGRTSSDRSSRSPEQKSRRDLEHLQEQLEIHVQTIGILVAEKSDLSAKLSQSFKQLERKQSEMDELHGRLKASRERVQEFEKEIQNSTANVQKREMIAKESDKENDRLKLENIRQSQLIEDLKVQLTERSNEQQQIIDRQSEQIAEFLNEQKKIVERDEIPLSTINNEDLVEQRNRLEQENHLFTNAIEQWAQRYADIKQQKDHLTKLLTEKEDQRQTEIPPPSSDLREENLQLKRRIEELEDVIVELQKETDTIGDYIRLYQEQREEWQRRYQEKDDLIKELTDERDSLRKTSSNSTGLSFPSSSSSSSADDSSKEFVSRSTLHLCSTCRGAVHSV